MSDMIRTILIMSVSGSILALLLFILKPMFKNRLPKSTQYYLWLVVIATLLVPVSKLVVLPAESIPVPSISNMVERYVVNAYDVTEQVHPYEDEKIDGFISVSDVNTAEVEAIAQNFWATEFVNWRANIYPLGVMSVFAFYLCVYFVFLNKIKRTNIITDINCIIPVYRNAKAATPMLIGLFRPMIVLPDRIYTDAQLRAILPHELTHMRRRDILVKWLTVVTCAIHWFNPFVWIIHREIVRACELSCDEAVIRNLDAHGKQEYGETLIYVAADIKTPHAVLSTTMCEEKKALKERLGAIMKNKKNTRNAVIFSAVLIFAAAGTSIVLSASRGKTDDGGKIVSSDNVIPLNELMELAAKGDDLQIEDFAKYNGNEVGFGLYILNFTVEGGYSLLVGSGNTTGKPFYVTLHVPGIEENIDIRYSSIEELISKYPVPNELENKIRQYIDVIMSPPSYSSATGDYIRAHQAEYDEILDMGITALPALTGILNMNDKGLRGNIAALAVHDIIKLESSKPHSEWEEGTLSSAGSDVEKWSKGFSVPSYLLEPNAQTTSSPAPNDISAELDSRIDNVIVETNFGKYGGVGNYQTASHTILKTVESSDSITVYIMALYQEYTNEDGIRETGGRYTPVSITFTKPDFHILEYWTPIDGSYYITSIKEKFPQELWDKVDTQLYIQKQQEICMQRAIEYYENLPPPTADNTLYKAYYLVARKLFDMDTGLNNDIKLIGIDMAGVQDSERKQLKNLLLMWVNDINLKPYFATYEELVTMGFIVTEPIEEAGFKDGVLIQFAESSFKNDTLIVNASKYRWPLGAVGAEFTVHFKDGAWTVGEPEMVWMS